MALELFIHLFFIGSKQIAKDICGWGPHGSSEKWGSKKGSLQPRLPLLIYKYPSPLPEVKIWGIQKIMQTLIHNERLQFLLLFHVVIEKIV